jgi:hypothetical protein
MLLQQSNSIALVALPAYGLGRDDFVHVAIQGVAEGQFRDRAQVYEFSLVHLPLVLSHPPFGVVFGQERLGLPREAFTTNVCLVLVVTALLNVSHAAYLTI